MQQTFTIENDRSGIGQAFKGGEAPSDRAAHSGPSPLEPARRNIGTETDPKAFLLEGDES